MLVIMRNRAGLCEPGIVVEAQSRDNDLRTQRMIGSWLLACGGALAAGRPARGSGPRPPGPRISFSLPC